MRLRDTLMLRFDRNTLHAALVIVWLVVATVAVVTLAPNLSGNTLTVVVILVFATPVFGGVLLSRYLSERRTPVPTPVAHPQIPDLPDVPKVEPATAPDRQPTDSFAGELERLVDLHERGVLTDEEFKQAKQNVLLP